ncbi:hypothetical protein R3W88_000192 [Solanum pinnatisectum]|uniref:Isopenicillin N synthase-like Fe(2+) 2OG dioxygenase domain-containing protein n=1 Tax=Solanum pinnatisectum TaxID=50273 RepID=A0AAV9MEM6_9SOLN|nr:hypothetical protein R3W88_000192 [Solanum pinnatisectum]
MASTKVKIPTIHFCNSEEGMFDTLKEVFDFPLSKLIEYREKPFHIYDGQITSISLYGSVSPVDLVLPNSVEAFFNTFWSHGNPNYRFTNYKVIKGENENKSTLPSHTDSSYLTIIKQNQNGLQVLYKNGEWIELNHTSPKSYIVLSADVFMIIYSIIFFPNPDYTLKVPKELVDEEHPLIFKPFKLPEFNKYIMLGAKNGLGVKNYCDL